MTVHNAIYSRLSSDSAITALVSTRIFPDVAPQDQILPYVVFRVIDTIPAQVKDGASLNNTYNVEVMSFAKTFASAQSIIDACVARLDYWQGTSGGVTVRHCKVDSKGNMPFVPEQEVFSAVAQARVFTYNT